MNEAVAFWSALFADPESPGGEQRVTLYALARHGQPLLLLPRAPTLARFALRLYPAQTRRARLVRSLMALAWPMGLPAWLGQPVTLPIPSRGRLVDFLRRLAGVEGDRIPAFGALAGNTRTEGYRFLVVVFDDRHTPRAVVKVGLSPRAQDLIRRERDFLGQVPRNDRVGIPAVHASLDTPRVQAFALAPVWGRSPARRDQAQLPKVLDSWIHTEVVRPLRELDEWQELGQAAGEAGLPAIPLERLQAARVHPVLRHGDFAPWNIRVDRSGQWSVFDWERGRQFGVPGWDWFHYVVQTAILVERRSPPGLVRQLDRLLASAAFQAYAARTGLTAISRELLRAYLAYAVAVHRPAEGLTELRGLLAAWR